MLTVYGSAAFILLDEVGRTSLDIDVAGPYSKADLNDLSSAAEKAGLPVNPEEGHAGDHLEWISLPRLCLPCPTPETEIVLWQGRRLVVRTVSAPQLVASKLIRYDEIDQSDIRFLCFQLRIAFPDIVSAVETLPPLFRHDPVLRENVRNLSADMKLWRGTKK